MTRLDLLIDYLDLKLASLGLLSPATWGDVRQCDAPKLYAGRLFRSEPQVKDHIGLSYGGGSTYNIGHDLTQPFPIADNSVAHFQSQDVFEHVPFEKMRDVLEEIYRVLKPGALFRLSVPDYRCDVYADRSVRGEDGAIIFDPGGGGDFVDGQVVKGGHVWFPTYETVRELVENSSFGKSGRVDFLHYVDENGKSVLKDIDYSLGHVKRTPDHDVRTQNPRRAQSIVVDLRK